MISVFADPISSDPASDAIIRRLVAWAADRRSGVNYGGSKTLYVVPDDQPRVPVALRKYDPAMEVMLADGVPIPPDAKANLRNTDHSLAVLQGDAFWDLWLFGRNTDSSPFCSNAGHTTALSENPGFYNPLDWSEGRHHSSFLWGHRSTSIPLILGCLTQGKLAAAFAAGAGLGEALALMVPEARYGEWAWPAQRHDGIDGAPDSIPEGARVFLSRDFDISRLHGAALQTLALTAQEEGMIVVDQTGDALGWDSVNVIDLTAPAGTPAPPRWSELLGTDTHPLVRDFPWADCFIARMDLRTKAGW